MTAYYLHGSWPQLDSNFREALYALFSFTFLGEVWGGDFFPGSMAPYWTFPYEWTYYLLFGTLWYLRGWWRLLIVTVICLIVGPEILMFFPLWLLGTATYWLSNKLDLSISAGRTLMFTGILLALLGNALVLYFHLDFGFGAQESPDLWPFYLAAILFAATAVGFRFAGIAISRYTGWAQWIAGGSGTLYLLHFSLGRFINGLIPFTWHPKLRWLLLVIPIIAVSLLFAQIAERRREAWRKAIEAGLAKGKQAAAFLEKKRRKKLSLL
jgi:peptidoglycan/LPS O-acetylase OafA/YrhL